MMHGEVRGSHSHSTTAPLKLTSTMRPLIGRPPSCAHRMGTSTAIRLPNRWSIKKSFHSFHSKRSRVVPYGVSDASDTQTRLIQC
jgi:hypothetical protein